MLKYILRRLLMLIPVMMGVTFLVYFIISLTPGDAASIILGDGATEEAVIELREKMGFNDPIILQYTNYIKGLLSGDMGISYDTGKNVSTEIIARFPNTFKLTVIAIFLSVVISIPIGVISATRQYSIFDNIGMILALVGISMPTFWIGLMLIILFSLNFSFFPSGGMDGWKSLILPAFTLAIASTAGITRTTRSSMLEVIRQDYINTAKAKGVSRKVVIRKHALKNALIPAITVIGLEFGVLLGGAVLTETVFAWPGIGRLMVQSIQTKDTPMVLGCVIVFALSFSIVNLIIDILYAYIDPRIKANYS
ncbi:ABC transporter permease [Marinisporobacter balticus]|uniref:Peptide/nickel transport system permease protein n=1 Tax=Marinisporobacter balticus TaxID=2018667 RepID=A0A4R2KRT4_9FIRM|nr:ABC transporter permease [Marinisporobacter balticus]TCO69345.1 peptide/nickel transport system permease protein [Marinisporobacter balticus]